LDKPEEALEIFRQATRQIAEGSDAEMVSDIYTAMGDILQESGKMNEAYACYESALEYNPNNFLVLNNYAYFLAVENRDLEKAEQMSRRTIENEPDNATYLDTYAWIMYMMKHYDEALTYIMRAIEGDPQPSTDLCEHAGDIHYRLGDTEQALHYWNKALNLQREAGEVDKNLEKKIKDKKL
jgi:tetratricopeptide (TPR) repeat protein